MNIIKTGKYEVNNLNERTTVMVNSILKQRVHDHVALTDGNLTDFYNRAILNELERIGDYEIRDLVERYADGE